MKRKGFTLMELIAAMAILSILALIIIPNFLQYIPEAGSSQCQKNKETILMKYQYAIQRDNRKMHDNIYGDTLTGLIRLENIQASVLEEAMKQVHCSKDGVYTIEDESTVNATLIRVKCSEHDDDLTSEEDKMLDEVYNGVYKNIEYCLTMGNDEAVKNCLRDRYGPDSFKHMEGDKNQWKDFFLYRDENLTPLIKKLNGGEFPELSKDLFDASVPPKSTLYIRPKVLSPDTKEVILIASTTQSGWSGQKAVYIEGKWYKSKTHKVNQWNQSNDLEDLTIIGEEITIEHFKQLINSGDLIPIANESKPSS